jgi:hypothetical protein
MWKWLLTLTFVTNAWGYSLTQDFVNGFYWASLPINLAVVDSNSSRKALITNLARTAIGEWESKTGLSLWNFSEGGTKNVIRWSNNFAAETKMDPTSVLAVAIRYTNGPYFAKTEIIINGSHYLNSSREHLLTTITHELGHTIGLDHSENMMALMAPTLQNPYMGLHQDDLLGMEEAYAQTEERQLTGYISPLAYKTEESSSSPLSCGTVGVNGGHNGFFSLGIGLLIGLLKKLLRLFTSLF